MNSPHKIALIGSNGKAGSVILSELIANHFHVNALVRDQRNLPCISSNLLHMYIGDATDETVLADLIKDCDVIINACSNRGNKTPVSSDITKKIINLMNSKPADRYLVITGKTVKSASDSFSIRTVIQRMLLRMMYPKIVQNKQEEYFYLKQSTINWTMVRCPLLVDGETKDYSVSENRCDGNQLTKQSLALFLISEIRNAKYIRKCPFVFNTNKID
jgi:putative NADH-flavin reductase